MEQKEKTIFDYWRGNDNLLFFTQNDLKNYLFVLMTYKTLSEKLERYVKANFKEESSKIIKKYAMKDLGYFIDSTLYFRNIIKMKKSDFIPWLIKALHHLAYSLSETRKDPIFLNYYENIKNLHFDYNSINKENQLRILCILVEKLLKDNTMEEFFEKYPEYQYPVLGNTKKYYLKNVDIVFSKGAGYICPSQRFPSRGIEECVGYIYNVFRDYEFPLHPLKFEKIIYEELSKIAGEELTRQTHVGVDLKDVGAPGGELIDGKWWIEKGIPFYTNGLIKYNANFEPVSLKINEKFIEENREEIIDALAEEGIIPFDLPGLHDLFIDVQNSPKFNKENEKKFNQFVANIPEVKSVWPDLASLDLDMTRINRFIPIRFKHFEGDYYYKQFLRIKESQSYDIDQVYIHYIFEKELYYFIKLHPEFSEIIVW